MKLIDKIPTLSIYHLIIASARNFLHTGIVMKPKTDPISDSLVSGMPLQDQTSQPFNTSSGVPFANPTPPVTGVGSTFQTPDLPQMDADLQTSPFLTNPPNPMQENPLSGQPIQPVETTPVNSAFSNSSPLTMDTNTQPAAGFTNPQPTAPPVPQNIQTTSPFDTPPAPPSQPQPAQAPVNLGSSILEEKPKKSLPFFLILLLFLVVVVLGAVGYLAYQNYNLSKNISKTDATSSQPSLSKPEVETDPYAGYVTYKSTIIPIEFMTPASWKVEETEEKDLANQKMINVTSVDFAYGEGEISKGYEFRIGPIDDLIKKYDSFDAFSAEENSTNLYTQRSVNGTSWLIKGNEAKTLVNNTPLTIALYSSADLSSGASEIFNKILNSIKITQTSSNTPVSTVSATPS